MSKIRKLIVTGLGTGYLPVAPGTWGSAAVCVVFLAVALASSGRTVCVAAAMLVIAVPASFGCVRLGRFAETAFGRRDPGPVTLDEYAGQAVALILLPIPHPVTWRGCLIVAAVAFGAFRLLDIIKPPPARRLEKLPGGWGILADDLVAGLYANVLAQLVLRLALNF